jgi:hypothetical protein
LMLTTLVFTLRERQAARRRLVFFRAEAQTCGWAALNPIRGSHGDGMFQGDGSGSGENRRGGVDWRRARFNARREVHAASEIARRPVRDRFFR